MNFSSSFIGLAGNDSGRHTAFAISRSLNFWILPVLVFGMSAKAIIWDLTGPVLYAILVPMIGRAVMAKRRPKPVHQMTIAQFVAAFPNEEACARYLVARRWPEGIRCPRCGNDRVFEVKSMAFKWQCYKCAPDSGYRFSHIAGTIFENTNKPLCEWFKVVHLMLTSKKGISSLQIQRMMGFGSYETALNMTHKIRAALVEPETKLGGIVELDETYIGGKDFNRHWDKKSKVGGGPSAKTPIMGAVSRKGNVIARVLDRVNRQNANCFVK